MRRNPGARLEVGRYKGKTSQEPPCHYEVGAAVGHELSCVHVKTCLDYKLEAEYYFELEDTPYPWAIALGFAWCNNRLWASHGRGPGSALPVSANLPGPGNILTLSGV